MIIKTSDVLHHESIDVDTQIEVKGTSIQILIQSKDSDSSPHRAISLLTGDVSKKDPFIVSLNKGSVLQETSSIWDIDTINACQMMQMAQLITGDGKGDYRKVLDLISKDVLDNESWDSTPIGSSIHSRYIVKGLCIFSIKHNKISVDCLKGLDRVLDRFQKEAFFVSRYSIEEGSLIAKARSLSSRGKCHV